MQIKQVEVNDYPKIYRLVAKTFATAEHSDGNESHLVELLRKSDSFVPKLSLAAYAGNEPIGHILFTKALVGTQEVLALAPLSVKPKYQRQGVGAALIKEGHKIASELGYKYIVVLGSESYYPRFGYKPAAEMGIEAPKNIPVANLIAVKLSEDAPKLAGKIIYAKEFGIEV